MIFMKRALFLSAVLFLFACSSAPAQSGNEVAAKVGGRSITTKELDEKWAKDDPAAQAEATQKVYEGRRAALDAIVAEMLIAEAAKAKGTSVESFELSGRYGFHMMLIPFLNEVEELRAKMQAYFRARKAAGHDPSTARVLGVYHTYVGESTAQSHAAAAQGLAEYNSAAREAHNLTAGMADPESYRSHERHREQMKVLTFDELVDQSRVLAGTPAEVCDKLEYVRERLYLTDMAGNFALGGLTDAQTRASMRRFMEHVAPKMG